MAYSALVVLAGCVALATAQIPKSTSPAENDKDAIIWKPPQLPNLVQPLANAPQEGINFLQNALTDLSSRLGGAYVATYDSTRDNVDDALNTIRETGQKGVESGVKLFKNGVGLLFLLPQFGRNFISNQANNRPNQNNPQFVPQNNPQFVPQNNPQFVPQYNPQYN